MSINLNICLTFRTQTQRDVLGSNKILTLTATSLTLLYLLCWEFFLSSVANISILKILYNSFPLTTTFSIEIIHVKCFESQMQIKASERLGKLPDARRTPYLQALLFQKILVCRKSPSRTDLSHRRINDCVMKG